MDALADTVAAEVAETLIDTMINVKTEALAGKMSRGQDILRQTGRCENDTLVDTLVFTQLWVKANTVNKTLDKVED